MFSIIIPTYERPKQLFTCVCSVMDQTFDGKFEVIVVDDGTPNRDEIIRTLEIFPEIILLHQSHQGVSTARNYGVQRATGEWLCFLDSDDTWVKTKLKEHQKFIEEFPQFQLHQTKEIWIRNGKQVNPSKKYQKKYGDLFRQSLELCAITPSSVCINKQLFDELGGFDPNLPACEDYDLWLKITSQYQVGLIDKFLLNRYGGHSDQLSVKYPVMDRFRVHALLKLLVHQELTKNQIQQVKAILIQKISVLIIGSEKRKKSSEIFKKLLEKLIEEKENPCMKNHIFSNEIRNYLLNHQKWTE